MIASCFSFPKPWNEHPKRLCLLLVEPVIILVAWLTKSTVLLVLISNASFLGYSTQRDYTENLIHPKQSFSPTPLQACKAGGSTRDIYGHFADMLLSYDFSSAPLYGFSSSGQCASPCPNHVSTSGSSRPTAHCHSVDINVLLTARSYINLQ